jgi:sulfopyruvate decarboxylase subunit alpha
MTTLHDQSIGTGVVPRYAEEFVAALHDAGVSIVGALPESHLKSIYVALDRDPGIRYVRVSNEADLPGLVAGAYLGGSRALMMMENSGLRQACEPIARFAYAHHVPLVMVVSYRGDFGEKNWWGHNHAQVMQPLLDALRIPFRVVDRVDQIRSMVAKAFDHAIASQWPVCLVLTGECTEGGADATP